MTRRRTLALAALAVGALSCTPALAAPPVVPPGEEGVVVERTEDEYVCVGTAKHGKYCVVVWYPGS